MRTFDKRQVFKGLLLAGGAGMVVLAVPASAQNVDCRLTPNDPSCVDVGADILDTPDPTSRIVVTGSRISRRDYEANSPIVTVDEALLEQSSTSAIEQNLNKLPQFTPAKTPTVTGAGDIQPTATNTPGSATVSLRGIGANRNLVLLDGRRATPGNASGVVDISTIPSAAIERVEIISGGASATYGADAVAGVTNFILKKNFQGLELDGQLGISQEGDGFEYRVSGIMGSDFADGNGNVSLAMSLNTREGSNTRDRDYYRELWDDPNAGGGSFFLRNPGINFGFGNPINQAAINSIFTQATTPIPNQNIVFYANPDGTIFSGGAFADRGGAYRQQNPDDINYKINSAGTIVPIYSNSLLVLPLTRYNALARGNYEINDWIGLFGQALFSRVETSTRQEAGPLTGGWAASIPYGNGVYTGGVLNQYTSNISSVLLNGVNGYLDNTPGILSDNPTNPAFTAAYGNTYNCANNALGGCTNTQLFAAQIPAEFQTLLNARANPDAPFVLNGLLPQDRTTNTDVTTYNLLAGFEGSVPGTDWAWEAFVNHGVSDTFANQQGIFSLQRLRTLATSPGFGQGFQQQGNAANGGFGASTGICTTGLNPLGSFANVSEDCYEAARADLKNRSKVRQTILEANVTGSLFKLWSGGDLQFALGGSFREIDFEFLNDTLTTQGRSFIDQALGIYPSGNATGLIDTYEVYGELLVPILQDTFVDSFDLELGGRISDYSTTGTSYTYKILGDLAVTDWFRLRGGYNRAERAPNIGELFLAAQQTFGINNRGDVCSRGNPNSFSANPANPNAAQIEAVCRVLMQQSGDPTAAQQFYAGTQPTGSFGFAFPTTVGNRNLAPEVADTWTAGVVLSSPIRTGLLSSLRLTVDYFNIAVKDAIAVQTVGSALQQCFDPSLNPLVLTDPTAAANTQFCQNVPRNQTGQLGNVFVTYVNNGRFRVSGIDATIDFGFDIGPGTLNINSLFNYLIDFKSADLPTNPLVEYAGTFGTSENGLNNGSFEYRVLTTVGYRVGGFSLGGQWQYLPSVKASDAALLPNTPVTGGPSYSLFNLNASAQITEAVNIRFGVDNLLAKDPPLVGINTGNTQPTVNGLTPGGAYNDLFYDTQGRRFYLGANVRF